MVWNKELLYVGGFLSRAVCELELTAIQTSWEEGANGAPDLRPSSELQDWLHECFIHILKFFSFHHSTPSSKVAKLLQVSFYACSMSPLRLLSSIGVCPAPDIRMFDPFCTKFIKDMPILSSDIAQLGERIIKALPDQHKIPTLTPQEVLQDLRKHTLNEEELVACLQWQVCRGSTADMAELLEVTRFWGADRKAHHLFSVRYFIDSKTHIPSDGPLPGSVVPPRVSTRFASPEQLIKTFKIGSADHNYDFTQSIDWAECVLSSISRAWSSSQISESDLLVFSDRACIPTIHGLRHPDGSYLPIDAFNDLDLPIVHLPSGLKINLEMESLLRAMKVRQCLPPQLLTQMVETGKWSTSNLIDYLVRVSNSLTSMELSELKSSDMFAGIQKDASKTRFRANELYPPMDSF
ncbi:hypothetical protein J3R83DRAFT_3129 [Lanmaoa asiatica]|nr:hypothetical protein J3R83DRAFT_3129 [Lanmaoa asiatica]